MVWLTPAMDGLFTGSASERRRFLDRLPDDPGLILEHEPLMHLARDGELKFLLRRAAWPELPAAARARRDSSGVRSRRSGSSSDVTSVRYSASSANACSRAPGRRT